MAKILVIEDEQNFRLSIRKTLTKSGYEVVEAASLFEARRALQQAEFDLILTDVQLGNESGIDLLPEVRGAGFDGVFVVMTAFGTVEQAVAAMRDGADDYLQKPVSLEELSIQTGRWLQQRTVAKRLKLYERLEKVRDQETEILGDSAPWKATMDMADRLSTIPLPSAADTSGPGSLPCIMLVGETGVGKGVLARHIHQRACAHLKAKANGHGNGSTPPFVHVNCSALPPTLVEAELFGHEKGAFTDARDARPGLFEMADGGTIFLDEISEMPLELQAKLLLVVEHGTFRRVGGAKERRVRVRVLAATNQDLEQRCSAGSFRRDLLYRLNAFTLRIPPLRERAGDAEKIADALQSKFARRFGRGAVHLTEDARAAIAAHPWPGNVRELVNSLQRAVMLTDDPAIEPDALGLGATRLSAPPDRPSHTGNGVGIPAVGGSAAAPGGHNLAFDFVHGVHNADEVERLLITQALEFTGGNVSRAAKVIGMQRSSLRYRIERYRLEGFTKEVARR